MLRDLEPRLARLDVLLGEMENRGIRFFDETVRLGRIKTLLDSEGVKRAFAHEVVGDTPQEIEAEVGRVIDWIVERNLSVWQDIQLRDRGRRPAPRGDDRRGRLELRYNRQALLDSVGRVSREVIGGYDREGEARAIANDVQGTFATAALAEAGAVGSARCSRRVMTGAAADVTGHPARSRARHRRVLSDSAAAAAGAAGLPGAGCRPPAPAQEGLTRQAHQEIGQSTERVNEAIAPYRRFVETQQAQLNEARGELVAAEDALLRLREIERR